MRAASTNNPIYTYLPVCMFKVIRNALNEFITANNLLTYLFRSALPLSELL